MANPIDLSVSCDGLQALVRAIRQEADGKELRKELAKNMRDALKPAAVQAKSGIASMASGGAGPGTSPALRSAIAKKIRPEVKLGGRWTGARVKARKTPTVRGFANAPKRTQSDTWRTQSWGNGVWRNQPGKLNWFDRATSAHKAEYKQAVFEAMEAMAERIANRAQ
ncbi:MULTISPECIES: hypothetical protein [Streptomyces]|uniref:HK97 gp10 family phage protein n=1 Tax=Streptomyces dengpaensis TaxID=2049881 RepID=A0ABM6SV85_9ACTN|nr:MULTISPECIES: hypothetical protein [Streptomyces]AVH58661.1 hypothetical protein C4B68_26095 [Streptomyces dengpaensis]PIB11278.1 hypothetical protein B1C81_05545 [Streptomyces sp. HG99]